MGVPFWAAGWDVVHENSRRWNEGHLSARVPVRLCPRVEMEELRTSIPETREGASRAHSNPIKRSVVPASTLR